MTNEYINEKIAKYEVLAESNEGCTLLFQSYCKLSEIKNNFRKFVFQNGWDNFGYVIKEIREIKEQKNV